ncbi:hypothetical protein Pan258_02050 [Symmachiella dynata]|nr:hypothetical protein Pan258_02050 [Symmachiella dynata]
MTADTFTVHIIDSDTLRVTTLSQPLLKKFEEYLKGQGRQANICNRKFTLGKTEALISCIEVKGNWKDIFDTLRQME